MKLKEEKGFTGVDISISIIIIFIFVSIIVTLSYELNSSSQKIKARGEALEIAIYEIENIKGKGFLEFENLNSTSNIDKMGNKLKNQSIDGKSGYYKSILVQDYSEINTMPNIKKNLVKKISVIISYQYKGEEEKIELSTILTKFGSG